MNSRVFANWLTTFVARKLVQYDLELDDLKEEELTYIINLWQMGIDKEKIDIIFDSLLSGMSLELVRKLVEPIEKPTRIRDLKPDGFET